MYYILLDSERSDECILLYNAIHNLLQQYNNKWKCWKWLSIIWLGMLGS